MRASRHIVAMLRAAGLVSALTILAYISAPSHASARVSYAQQMVTTPYWCGTYWSSYPCTTSSAYNYNYNTNYTTAYSGYPTSYGYAQSSYYMPTTQYMNYSTYPSTCYYTSAWSYGSSYSYPCSYSYANGSTSPYPNSYYYYPSNNYTNYVYTDEYSNGYGYY